jgi:hypothetical protein
VGKVTLKSNSDEAHDEFLLKITAMKRLTMFFHKSNSNEAFNGEKKIVAMKQ